MEQRKIATYLQSIIHMEDQVSQLCIPPEVCLYIVKDIRGDALHGSTENTKEVFSWVVDQQIEATQGWYQGQTTTHGDSEGQER